MTYPECTPEPPRAGADSSDSVVDALHPEPHVVSKDIFDCDMFEDLHELLGSACARAALEDLSLNIEEIFPDIKTQCLDQDQVFQHAHSLVAGAGMLGFTALRDASYALQAACRSQTQIGETYERAREAALVTRDAIALLLQRPL